MEIKLIVGLGNPEPEYEKTFHNAGRMFVLFLAEGGFQKEKLFAYAPAGGRILVLPSLNMNESGPAVREAAKKFRAAPEEILVAQDDSDLVLGSYKLSFGRGSAGHKGAESVMNALGTENFYRLRFGIRSKEGKAGEFVLKTMGKEELEELGRAFYGAKVNVIEKVNPLGVG